MAYQRSLPNVPIRPIHSPLCTLFAEQPSLLYSECNKSVTKSICLYACPHSSCTHSNDARTWTIDANEFLCFRYSRTKNISSAHPSQDTTRTEINKNPIWNGSGMKTKNMQDFLEICDHKNKHGKTVHVMYYGSCFCWLRLFTRDNIQFISRSGGRV